MRLKERKVASEVLAVTLGPASVQEVLRHAMGLGADRALHIVSEQELQPLAIARLLAAVVKREQPGMAFLGKQAIDDDSNQTVRAQVCGGTAYGTAYSCKDEYVLHLIYVCHRAKCLLVSWTGPRPRLLLRLKSVVLAGSFLNYSMSMLEPVLS